MAPLIWTPTLRTLPVSLHNCRGRLLASLPLTTESGSQKCGVAASSENWQFKNLWINKVGKHKFLCKAKFIAANSEQLNYKGKLII